MKYLVNVQGFVDIIVEADNEMAALDVVIENHDTGMWEATEHTVVKELPTPESEQHAESIGAYKL